MRHFVNNVWLENDTSVSLESHGKRYIGILKIEKKKLYVEVDEIQQLNNNERVTELNKELVRKYFYWEDIENVYEQEGQCDVWLRIFLK